MRLVYSNSIITISATHATGPDQGLFFDRDMRHSECVSLFWRPTSDDGPARFTLSSPSASQEPMDGCFKRLKGSPLLMRKWAIQEIVLSPRVVSFTDQQVYWQCSEFPACEAIPYDRIGMFHWAQYHPFWALTGPKELLRFNDISYSEDQLNRIAARPKNCYGNLQQRWIATLDRYCHASLTYPSKDIFKAIEGVGQRVAQLTDGVCRHGVLDSTLPSILLWGPMHGKSRRMSTRAPTWHWASWEGQISFEGVQKLHPHPLAVRKDANSPLVHCFMSADCDFWPLLLCIGRLIRLDVQGPKTDDLASTTFTFPLTGQRIDPMVDFDARSDGARDEFALLPVNLRRMLKYDNTFYNQQYDESLHMMCFSLRETWRNTFYRIGVCYLYPHEMHNVLEELCSTKPTMLMLE